MDEPAVVKTVIKVRAVRGVEEDGMRSVAEKREVAMKICVLGLRGLPHVMGGVETHCEQLFPLMKGLHPDDSFTIIGRKGYLPEEASEYHGLRIVSLPHARGKHLETILAKHPHLNNLLHPKLPYKQIEVVWAARHEMARTLEDVLARRTRSLFLNAQASLDIAPAVAHLLAQELGKDKKWEEEQTQEYQKIANNYLCRVG